jgi:hypothetical protein
MEVDLSLWNRDEPREPEGPQSVTAGAVPSLALVRSWPELKALVEFPPGRGKEYPHREGIRTWNACLGR